MDGSPHHTMPGSAGGIAPRELDSLADYVLSLEVKELLLRTGFSSDLGQRIPHFSFSDAAGQAQSIEQLRGKVVLVSFWGTTCRLVLRNCPS